MTHEARMATIEQFFLLTICMSYLIWRYLGFLVCARVFSLLILFLVYSFCWRPLLRFDFFLFLFFLLALYWLLASGSSPGNMDAGNHAVAISYILAFKSVGLCIWL